MNSNPSVTETDTPETAIADRQPQTNTRGRYDRFKEWHENWLPIINASLAFLAVIVVIIQSIIMYRQTRIMNKQTQIMDKALAVSDESLRAFRVSERAYVGIESITADLEAGEVVIMLHNIGSIPAKAVMMDVEEIRVTPSPGLETTQSGERVNENQQGSRLRWRAGEVPLFPGTPMAIVVTLEKFEPEEVSAIASKKEILYVGGTIEYQDGFGNSDRTVFAFQYNPANKKWVAHSDLSKFLKEQ